MVWWSFECNFDWQGRQRYNVNNKERRYFGNVNPVSMIDAGRGGEWISSGALNRFQFVIQPQRVIQVTYWRLWCWLAADRRPDLSLCHKLDSLGRNINLAAVWVFPQKFVLNSFDSFNNFFFSDQQHESWRWPSSNFRKTSVIPNKSLKKILKDNPLNSHQSICHCNDFGPHEYFI